MRSFICALCVLIPAIALAQAPVQPAPAEQVLQAEITQLEIAKLNFQMQAATEKARADDLQKQLDAMKKAETPAK